MKLSPPASSSDIEVARQIARRLHQRRRREDRPGDAQSAPPPTTHVPPRTVRQRAPAPRPVPQQVPPPPPPVPPAAAAPPAAQPPAAPAHPHAPARWAEEPAPPSWDAIPADLPHAHVEGPGNKEPEDALDALTAPAADSPAEESAPSAPGIELDDEPIPDAQPGEPAVFDEADAFGGTPEASPFGDADVLPTPDLEEPELVPPDLGPRDLEADDLGADELGAEAVGDGAGLPEEPAEEEELFDDRPGPSWGDVVEACMSLAHARGALLADATGELVAARGEWPDPGADAIASRLVAMMDRTLKDAPTRSVSAPVGGQHLTAWRVPVGERLLTAAFIADAPVRSETRPSIDLEVQRGATA